MEDLPIDLLINWILPYVGEYQFRYVAPVSRKFYTAYTMVYPAKQTNFIAAVCTVKLAEISYPEMITMCRPFIMGGYFARNKKEMLCAYAAATGKLDSIQYLRKHGCDWNELTCTSAAANGHLNVLQWAHENGCPWDERVCSEAAANGHLNIVQWARENGCPWDARTCYYAAENGHWNIYQWAQENGCPRSSSWPCSYKFAR